MSAAGTLTATPESAGDNTDGAPRVSKGRLVLAFAAVYLLWGSTYLGIRIAIETVPPLLMAGFRQMLAGAILYLWVRARGTPAAPRREWGLAVLIGGLLLLGGNGGVSWAQQRVPSGLSALVVAFMPVWMVLMEWLRPGGSRPNRSTLLGIALGAVGLSLLVGPVQMMGGAPIDPIGAVVLLGASLSWAAGSLVSRETRGTASPFLATAMQMLAGGALLIVAGYAGGEGARVDLDQVSLRSALAFLYLVVFGSLAGFTAYIWLLGATSVAKASTYAYVNPVVAVLLGWAFANEPLTPRVLIAAAIIVASVAIITIARTARPVPDLRLPRGSVGGSPGR